jgi:hypothetical protein
MIQIIQSWNPEIRKTIELALIKKSKNPNKALEDINFWIFGFLKDIFC